MNVAVLTYGRLVAPVGHADVAEFDDAAEAVFAAADRSKGFIWRFGKGASDETRAEYDAYAADPKVSMTLSVWETAEAIRDYAFCTLHNRFYKRRAEWFEPQEGANMVMWNVPKGHRPDYPEALERLAEYNENGASDRVFRFEDLGITKGVA